MIYLFYGSQLVETYPSRTSYRYLFSADPNKSLEIYNGGYVLITGERPHNGWYRCDLTPVLLEHVPKILRLEELLLN